MLYYSEPSILLRKNYDDYVLIMYFKQSILAIVCL